MKSTEYEFMLDSNHLYKVVDISLDGEIVRQVFRILRYAISDTIEIPVTEAIYQKLNKDKRLSKLCLVNTLYLK